MKKLLFALTLSSLFVACNNKKMNSVELNRADTCCYPPPVTNFLIDTTTAYKYDTAWSSFNSKLPTPLSASAFVINATALSHAINDSTGIANVIFYLGMDSKGNPTLMFLPTRSTSSPYTEVVPTNNGQPQVFDQSVPCPTCMLEGPIPPKKP